MSRKPMGEIETIVEDIEGLVSALHNKWKKEWPARWRARVAAGGSTSTMETNFQNWTLLLESYLEGNHAPISQGSQAKVAELRKAWKEEIQPVIEAKKGKS